MPQLMRGESGLEETRMVEVLRSFAVAVPDAPAHRRLPLLQGCLKVPKSRRLEGGGLQGRG